MRTFLTHQVFILSIIFFTILGCGSPIDAINNEVDHESADPSSNDPEENDADEEPSNTPASDDEEEIEAETPTDDSTDNGEGSSTENETEINFAGEADEEETAEGEVSSETVVDNTEADSSEISSTETTETSPAEDTSTQGETTSTGIDGSTDPAVDSGGTEEPSPTPTETTCDPDFSLALVSTDIGGNLSSSYEPSGAVWHSGLNKLFIVDDEGTVSMIDSDGGNITNWSVGGDLEGITVADVNSDFIYIGVENPDSIKEFNVTTGSVTRTFTLTSWMTGADNQGLEALTFVTDETDGEGGYFYAGHQGEGKIYVFNLPIASSATSTTATFVKTITPVSGWTDISGLDYDEKNKTVYVIYDSYNTLASMETDGTIIDTWSLPGNDQEGIALGPECEWYVAEDDASHDVWKYEQ